MEVKSNKGESAFIKIGLVGSANSKVMVLASEISLLVIKVKSHCWHLVKEDSCE